VREASDARHPSSRKFRPLTSKCSASPVCPPSSWPRHPPTLTQGIRVRPSPAATQLSFRLPSAPSVSNHQRCANTGQMLCSRRRRRAPASEQGTSSCNRSTDVSGSPCKPSGARSRAAPRYRTATTGTRTERSGPGRPRTTGQCRAAASGTAGSRMFAADPGHRHERWPLSPGPALAGRAQRGSARAFPGRVLAETPCHVFERHRCEGRGRPHPYDCYGRTCVIGIFECGNRTSRTGPSRTRSVGGGEHVRTGILGRSVKGSTCRWSRVG
jgi:hypothetical protein